MPSIKLFDGKKIPFTKKIDGFEIANKISKSLSKEACIMKVNGKLKDLSFLIDSDAEVKIITKYLEKEQEDDYSLYSKTSVGFDFLSSSISPSSTAPNENQTGVYFATHSAGMIFDLYFGYKFISYDYEYDDGRHYEYEY